MADNDDFEKQLALEELEKKKKENVELGDPYTYTDPDGTVYEWDHEKQAWFPKVHIKYFLLKPNILFIKLCIYCKSLFVLTHLSTFIGYLLNISLALCFC